MRIGKRITAAVLSGLVAAGGASAQTPLQQLSPAQQAQIYKPFAELYIFSSLATELHHRCEKLSNLAFIAAVSSRQYGRAVLPYDFIAAPDRVIETQRVQVMALDCSTAEAKAGVDRARSFASGEALAWLVRAHAAWDIAGKEEWAKGLHALERFDVELAPIAAAAKANGAAAANVAGQVRLALIALCRAARRGNCPAGSNEVPLSEAQALLDAAARVAPYAADLATVGTVSATQVPFLPTEAVRWPEVWGVHFKASTPEAAWSASRPLSCAGLRYLFVPTGPAEAGKFRGSLQQQGNFGYSEIRKGTLSQDAEPILDVPTIPIEFARDRAHLRPCAYPN